MGGFHFFIFFFVKAEFPDLESFVLAMFQCFKYTFVVLLCGKLQMMTPQVSTLQEYIIIGIRGDLAVLASLGT